VRIVVDASVALKWVLDETRSEAAVALRDQELIAPVVWLAEAATALWRHVRTGEISNDEAAANFSELLDSAGCIAPDRAAFRAGAKLVTEIGHPVYDCLYLAFALRHDTHADRRFAATASLPGLTDRVRLFSG